MDNLSCGMKPAYWFETLLHAESCADLFELVGSLGRSPFEHRVAQAHSLGFAEVNHEKCPVHVVHVYGDQNSALVGI